MTCSKNIELPYLDKSWEKWQTQKPSSKTNRRQNRTTSFYCWRHFEKVRKKLYLYKAFSQCF